MNDYWKKREAAQLLKNLKDEQAYIEKINGYYDYMMDQIQKEINGFYAKYAKAEGITLSEAKRKLSKLDMEAYERKAKRYVEQKTFTKEANEEMRLYNATMKINRLELLKANIGLELVDGFDELQKYFDTILTERALSEFDRQAGILGKTVKDNAQAAHAIVHASFHNAKFSDRIWMYQDMMKWELSKLLQTGVMQGKNPRELARHLSKLFGVRKSDTERLIRSELARVQTEVQKQSFHRNRYDKYVFLALGNACSDCKAQDNGEPIAVKDMMPGSNAPPLHPNCRCSTAAYMDREEFDKWLENQEKNATIKENMRIPKMNLQFFSEKDIKNQESVSLKRAIRKYEKQISEHEHKIAHPEQHIDNWSDKDIRMQEGLIKHWNKEIRNFTQSVQDRMDELKARGDYDE